MKPVLFVTGHAPAYRVGAFARLHEREGIELALFGGRSQARRRRAAARCPFPTGTCARASCSRWRGERRLPRGRVPDRRAPGAAGDVGGRAPRARAADPVGVAVGAPAQRRARAQLPAAAAPVPLGRRRRHLRAARQRLRAARGARATCTWRRSRSTTTSGARRRRRAARARWPRGRGDAVPVRRARRARKRALGVLIEAWRVAGLPAPAAALVLVGRWAPRPRRRCWRARWPAPRPRRRRADRLAGAVAPRAAARRCTPRATCSSCRRSAPARFASRGVWWSTRR